MLYGKVRAIYGLAGTIYGNSGGEVRLSGVLAKSAKSCCG